MKTKQIDFWGGDFGKDYTDRNSLSFEAWNQETEKHWGISKHEINQALLKDLPKDAKILEVGCNIGRQLVSYQKMGFTNLYGIELQHYAVEKAKGITTDINIIQGSGFDLPFKDAYFDLVCTNGVLIHISPKDLPVIMSEIYRCSKQYISGFEYFSEELKEVMYRGNEGYLWKMDYAKTYQEKCSNLKVISKEFYPYISDKESGNIDFAFMLEKET